MDTTMKRRTRPRSAVVDDDDDDMEVDYPEDDDQEAFPNRPPEDWASPLAGKQV
jgi:hypothetical protein